MPSVQVSKIPLWWAIALLLLNGFAVHAQRFVLPASDVDVLGRVHGSIQLIWTYTTRSYSASDIICAAGKSNSDVNILADFVDKARFISNTMSRPFRIGFRLANLAFSDANVYNCTITIPPHKSHSRKYNLTIYDLPAAPINVKLVQSTPESIWIKWTAPRQPRSSRINKYLMELRHPNGTTTLRNYTIEPLDPILEYTFSNLLSNVRYSIRISAYNAYGKGQRSVLMEYETVYNGSILPTAPLHVKLVESTPDSIRIKWTAPQQEGILHIIWYLLDLFDPNGTTTTTNYTIQFPNPILDYTFSNLSANTKYGISISAGNAFGKGPRSVVVEYLTVYHKTNTSAGIHYGLNTSSIYGIFIGMLFVLCRL